MLVWIFTIAAVPAHRNNAASPTASHWRVGIALCKTTRFGGTSNDRSGIELAQMQDLPPAQLVEMLERLGLATAVQVARIGPRVRRLAGDLPQFESIWVDALAQARVLTPFQAEEINAGRAPSLRVGPYCSANACRSRTTSQPIAHGQVDSQETVRLAVVENCGAADRRNPSTIGVACTVRETHRRPGESVPVRFTPPTNRPANSSRPSLTPASRATAFLPPRLGSTDERRRLDDSSRTDFRRGWCWRSPALCWPAWSSWRRLASATRT